VTSHEGTTPSAGGRPGGHTVVTVVLEREDGERVSFPCTDGEDLLAGANAAGCRPRVVCARGGCGACRAVLVEGSVEHQGGVSKSKMEATEPGGAEFVLMCRAVPLEDTVLRPLHRWARRPLSRLSAALPKQSELTEQHEHRQQPGQPGTH
jgi:ferredoxin